MHHITPHHKLLSNAHHTSPKCTVPCSVAEKRVGWQKRARGADGHLCQDWSRPTLSPTSFSSPTLLPNWVQLCNNSVSSRSRWKWWSVAELCHNRWSFVGPMIVYLKKIWSGMSCQESWFVLNVSLRITVLLNLYVFPICKYISLRACLITSFTRSGRVTHATVQFPRKSEISPKIRNFPENPKFPLKSEISPKIRNFP